ncbi:MAG: alpha-amylase family glycosyl hydrolase [Flavobacteriaceae bacterium]|nr:alpha-amylase family glycosyl hydrolase [Flavobacteriaceae bacterium]
MNKSVFIVSVILILSTGSCKEKTTAVNEKPKVPFVWEGANLYFLLTDRFNNGDPANDVNFDRVGEAAKLRGFEGGDIKGVTQKIQEGYFTDLGINAIWLSPIVEQIHGAVDEGTGTTFGFHGYWARDWTKLDPNFGTEEDLAELVTVAHQNGIRIVLDAVINHTGPVTEKDPVWPDDWVRTDQQCTYDNFHNTVTCTLVKNLPDIKTESNENVALPEVLVNKWKAEGRYEQEMQELDEFFDRTGYPRAPRFYIIKWLTDYIREFGIDGYRADTVKHTESYVWEEFSKECHTAFADWKTTHPDEVLDNNPFYLVGEVYGYNAQNGQLYDFGDKQVNYFKKGFHSLINFGFKYHAQGDYESLFSLYDTLLHNPLKNYGTLNYLTSHDDGDPFDKERTRNRETAVKLLLAPGTSQIYYGDESARPLIIEGTEGDATLRSNMNWDDPHFNETVLVWQKLGVFRRDHPAVGAGKHQIISDSPYVFSRIFSKDNFTDQVVVGLDLTAGEKILSVGNVFKDGDLLRDAYSNLEMKVKDGKVAINSPYDIVLLEKKQ